MNWWWSVLGGVLLIEGLMPLLLTKAWRNTFERMLQLRDGQIRFIGFISMLFGLFILWLNR
ncbi:MULTISPECIES: DUF2065 domain-containing protein [unclassified Methylophilus]|jgi:uncharacterized protein|uniref:DUF2065 domain-containing protein n=1 Tax=Methylophilus glucosoxydans TaxID=752553 RepID=A0ABW3GHH1_9PROT|nr:MULTISPECIES: DUF2065 domain-containing protein [unclassified Methylophilus]MBF5038818.1 DUF2065 domain-containing protein [Methylophilus sp. 13]MDF0376991.1 DUF2065 family protein [Methylophilus sp. YYY-1]MDT7850055.1 DUF2065 domain-containing protein [Methylophilus sp. VKM B-3414]